MLSVTFENLNDNIDWSQIEPPTLDDVAQWMDRIDAMWEMSEEDASAHDRDGKVLISHICNVVGIDDIRTLEYENVRDKFIDLRFMIANISKIWSKYKLNESDDVDMV